MAEPCYYSEPPRHVDTFCTDGGMASYAWTYADSTEPDYYLCKHHAASWRKQVARRDADPVLAHLRAEYALRSIPAAEPFE